MTTSREISSTSADEGLPTFQQVQAFFQFYGVELTDAQLALLQSIEQPTRVSPLTQYLQTSSERHVRKEECQAIHGEMRCLFIGSYAVADKYGLREKFTAWLLSKMEQGFDRRLTWLKSIGLRMVQNGSISAEGAPLLVMLNILNKSHSFGAEEFIQIVKAFIAETGVDHPQLNADAAAIIWSVRQRFNMEI